MTATVRAINIVRDTPNKIHSDEARRYGFRGGIVAGNTMYGYLAQELVDHYGEQWLGTGQMEVRFRRPVYDGDMLSLDIAPPGGDDRHVDLQIANEAGEAVVVGSAAAHRDDKVIDLADYPSRPYVEGPLPSGTPELLARHPPLADWELDNNAEYVHDFLTQVGADNEVFRRHLHPALIARVSAYIVGRRYDLGPRIHVSMRTRFLNLAPVGSQLTARGRIVRTWEKKGNHYLELDLLVVDQDERPIMQIDNVGLFQLGSGGD